MSYNIGKELITYLTSEDLEWFAGHLELAGVPVEAGDVPPPPREKESWTQRTEREFKETAIRILERQQLKHQQLIDKIDDELAATRRESPPSF